MEYEGEMTDASKPGPYCADATGWLLVDPYNDFLGEGGMLDGRGVAAPANRGN
ncbi:hypothetical protein [Cupriavidus taiwanensis]|uniref:hypothetical protein n=1 Tax=Cupriavidus taiwanensis TaxID=164546 RepID=UPI0015F257BD|nr:hypothetical protein [Cupriavidus taiwanensis]